MGQRECQPNPTPFEESMGVKSEYFQLRMSEKEKEMLQELADADGGLSISAYLRRLIHIEHEKLLRKRSGSL